MPPEKNEVDKFFQELPTEDKTVADIFTPPEKEGVVVPKPEEGDEPHKNRRHRRLESQLQEEREERIRLQALIEGRSEAQKLNQDTTTLDEDTKDLLRLYGDDDKGRQAAELTKSLLERVSERTKSDTIKALRDEEIESQQEERQYESYIDGQLESLEDEHNIDLTSDSPSARKARKGLLEIVQTLSPKDENGIITGYADFDGAFEVYQDRAKQERPDNTRNKEVASRSMERSGGTASVRKAPTPGFDGWKQDYGIN